MENFYDSLGMLFSLYHLQPPLVVRIAVGIQNVIYTPLIWNLFNVTDSIPVVKRTATAAGRVCHRITSSPGKDALQFCN